MPKIELSRDERAALVDKLRLYFREELDQDIGQFPAEFLLDFITQEIGPYYYNRGLYDAQTVLAKRVDTIAEAIDELIQPTEYQR
ncbi:MAG: DUF2164 domain-containing protein [Pseudomonadota bacterium]